MTLYLELGGRTAIRRAVLATQAGDQPAPQATLEDLTEFLVFLFGGAPVYEGPALHHTVAAICQGHSGFDRLADELTEALTRSPATAALARDVRQVLEQVRCHAVRGPHPVALSAAVVSPAQQHRFA
jgi:hypothetical protein